MKKFLEAYFDNRCHIGKACLAAGVSRTQVSRWKNGNDTFREAFETEYHETIYRSSVSLLLKHGKKSVRAASRVLDHIEKVKFGVDKRTGVSVSVTQSQAQQQSHEETRDQANEEKKVIDRQVLWLAPDKIDPASLPVRENDPAE